MEERSGVVPPPRGTPSQVSKFSNHGSNHKRRDRRSRWDESSSKKMKFGGDSPGFQRGRFGGGGGGNKFRNQQQNYRRRHDQDGHYDDQRHLEQQQQQQQQQQPQLPQQLDDGGGDGGGEFNHMGLLLVNQILMLDGSVRNFYSLPPDYPMPPDFRIVFPPEFAPVEAAWNPGPAAAPPYHPGVAVDAGYQPQFVAAAAAVSPHPRQDMNGGGGGGGSHHRKRNHWNRHKN